MFRMQDVILIRSLNTNTIGIIKEVYIVPSTMFDAWYIVGTDGYTDLYTNIATSKQHAELKANELIKRLDGRLYA